MPTFADVMGWTVSRADVSRIEEARGWLGRAVADPSEAGFDRFRDDPSDREEREAE